MVYSYPGPHIGSRTGAVVRRRAVRTVPADKAAALETLIRGSWAPNAIYSLCRLGVPDALTDDPRDAATAADLAARLHCNAPCLLRLLRLCAAYGLLVEVPRPQNTVRGGGGGGCGIHGSGGGGRGAKGDCAADVSQSTTTDNGAAERSEGTLMQAAAGDINGSGNGSDNGGGGGGCVCREAATSFHLTETGLMLQEEHPSQMNWLALMLGLPGHYVSRGYLYDNVKEVGRMGFEAAFGTDWYSYVGRHPLEAAAFDQAMTATSAAAAGPVAAAYDFSRHATVMDVGGGQGMLMAAILHRHPGVRMGFVMELPSVVAGARRMGQRGLERLQYVEGDFFQPFPPPRVDCIVMRLVLHDWPDAQAAAVLRHARAALAPGPGSRLVVVEAVLPEAVGPGAVEAATLQQLEFDMGMMVMTTGRERSLSEWEALFAASGFRLEALMQPDCAKLPLMVVRPEPEAEVEAAGGEEGGREAAGGEEAGGEEAGGEEAEAEGEPPQPPAPDSVPVP
ncbi:hypothetical protein PLESTB_000220400 [Pleodorina starrii]|uniref:O-methyltransferase domain-containing protein n=1 Tax=Pleodorina starrii TaxID=330485 RepID=A0A9W6BC46_9CHLO|nr:hypothetical protein PLESTB_000220400 [Pleodorina starrii]